MKHDGSPKTWLDMTIEYSWCVWHLSDSWLFAKQWSEFPSEACEKAWTSLSGQLMDFCKSNPLTILNLFLESIFQITFSFPSDCVICFGWNLVISSHRSRSGTSSCYLRQAGRVKPVDADIFKSKTGKQVGTWGSSKTWPWRWLVEARGLAGKLILRLLVSWQILRLKYLFIRLGQANVHTEIGKEPERTPKILEKNGPERSAVKSWDTQVEVMARQLLLYPCSSVWTNNWVCYVVCAWSAGIQNKMKYTHPGLFGGQCRDALVGLSKSIFDGKHQPWYHSWEVHLIEVKQLWQFYRLCSVIPTNSSGWDRQVRPL